MYQFSCVGMEVSWVYHILLILLVLVRVSSRGDECPPWFTPDHRNNSLFPQCVCSEAMSSYITCSQRERTSYVKIGYCALQDLVTNDTVVARCPYVFSPHLVHNGLIRLPHNLTHLNTFICGQLT